MRVISGLDTVGAAHADSGDVAFLLDVDGVLADTANLHTQAWREATQAEGIPFPGSAAEKLRGISREASLNLILEGRPIPAETFNRILENKNRRYCQLITRLTVGDRTLGVDQLLKDFAEHGVRTAAVSASKNAMEVLRRTGLADRFEVILDGRANTPRHRFLEASALLDVPAASCAVVEDAPENLRLAREFGMRTLGVGPAALNAGADVTVPDFTGLSFSDLAGRLFRRIPVLHTS